MKKIEMNYYESFDEYEYEYQYSLEEIKKLEDAGAFNEDIELEIALDELEELRGDDVIF